MSLKKNIALIQLKDFPPTIAELLLKRHDIVELVEAGEAEVPGVGRFKFIDMRKALAEAPLETFVEISSLEAGPVYAARAANAMFRVKGQSGVSAC